jgi:hypothetical protein
LGKRHVRRADRPGLASGQQPREFASRLGRRHLRIGGVQIEKIEVVGAQAAEALVDLGPDAFGPAVDHLPPRWCRGRVGLPVNAAFTREHHLLAPAAERRGDGPLTFAVLAVAIGRVEVRDPGVDGGVDGRLGRCSRDARAGHARERPAAEPQRADSHGRTAESARRSVHASGFMRLVRRR